MKRASQKHVCELCGVTVGREQTLKAHLLRQHRVGDGCVCRYCGRSKFMSVTQLEDHAVECRVKNPLPVSYLSFCKNYILFE